MSANADKQHVDFCERRFASDLIRRIRWWKWISTPHVR